MQQAASALLKFHFFFLEILRRHYAPSSALIELQLKRRLDKIGIFEQSLVATHRKLIYCKD
jgi:hypothetical protein